MSEELTEGTSAVEAKLAEFGADQVRSFSAAPEAAPEEGTPAETVSAEQPRNELGQFASQSESEEAVAAEEPEVTQAQDPAVAAFLSKYGGDVDKALAGAVHLQRKAGEQSNELGDLRRMVDELSQLRETVQADYQQRQQNVPLDQATVDWFDQAVMQNPQQALAWAQQQGNPMLLQRGIDTWKEVDPYGAAVYTNQLQNEQRWQQMERQIQQAQQLPQDASIHMALNNVRTQHPEYVNYDDAIEATLTNYPFMQAAVTEAASSGDRQKLEGAIETLYALAQRDTLANQALTGKTPEDATTSQEVVAPTVSETHEPAPEPTPMDEFRAAFKAEADRRTKGVWVAD